MPVLQHGSGYQAITYLAACCRRNVAGTTPLKTLRNHSPTGPSGVISQRRNNAMAKAHRSPKARKAMANRLARIVYRMLKYAENYIDNGREFYEQKYRQQQSHMLTKTAMELGLQLIQTA
jgi:hypothetical protein